MLGNFFHSVLSQANSILKPRLTGGKLAPGLTTSSYVDPSRLEFSLPPKQIILAPLLKFHFNEAPIHGHSILILIILKCYG